MVGPLSDKAMSGGGFFYSDKLRSHVRILLGIFLVGQRSLYIDLNESVTYL